MRPGTRGVAPRKYARYQDAIGDLEDRLDRYCSYCERPFSAGLAVEHVLPKSKNKKLKTAWSNFLLGCVNCNSAKGAKPTNEQDFLWPDRDNTLLAMSYEAGGLVTVEKTLSPQLQKEASNTIALVGLDRHPGQPPGNRPAKRDKRYMDREETWQLAVLQRDALAKIDLPPVRAMVASLAKYSGFFSVWMTVFRNDADMRRRIVAAYKGTAADCFDANWVGTSRPGGHL
jgi:uncharacterized protein (TIGR02646 family)